jgi:hypothetical protein
MRSPVLLVLAVVALVGCATAPKQFTFDPTLSIDANYDAVWSAVVEYFAVSSLPIATIEKDSGLIVTGWMDAGNGSGAENKVYCDCGGSGLNTQDWTRGKFNVFVKSLGDEKTQIRVTSTYQQGRHFSDVASTVNCSSTGFLEKGVHDYVLARVQNAGLPQVPVFAPGQGD